MTRQAVTKHLAILEEANLVAAVKRGREKLHYLNPVPINEIAERWIGKNERGRLRVLAKLKKNLEGKDDRRQRQGVGIRSARRFVVSWRNHLKPEMEEGDSRASSSWSSRAA